MKKVIIESNKGEFYLSLTEEQVAFAKWLFSKYIINSYIMIEDESWEEIK